MSIAPRYPIYIVSKGRAANPLTARFLAADAVDFHIVVEPQEVDEYASAVGAEHVLALPFENLGQGSIPARNWIWEHAKSLGTKRHWILDDNIRGIYRLYGGRRLHCESGPAFAAVEDFTDRYENAAIVGMNYDFFGTGKMPPLFLNSRVYSCLLIENAIEPRWRGRYNEDTDLYLQVMAAGLCTVLVNVFLIKKARTMSMTGGNTDELYQDDGRLRMARSLERVWPGVVETDRRFQRPQHVVTGTKKFDTPLRFRDGLTAADFAEPNEYGLALRAKREVKSAALRRLLERQADS